MKTCLLMIRERCMEVPGTAIRFAYERQISLTIPSNVMDLSWMPHRSTYTKVNSVYFGALLLPRVVIMLLI